LVSGYTVTFKSPWQTEVTSTIILSGEPTVGAFWTLTLTVDGEDLVFRHEVSAGETTEDIAAALAAAVNASVMTTLLRKRRVPLSLS